LYFTLLYRLAGPRPIWFFVGNAILFAVATAGLIHLMRAGGTNRRRPLLAGLFFVLSGPVVESYMTLSKPEPLQIALIMGSVLLVFHRRQGRASIRIGVEALGAAVLMLLADLTKETSLAIIPIGGVWLFGAWAQRRLLRHEADLARPAGFFLAALLAGGAFLILRSRFSTIGLPEDAYAGNYLLGADRLLTSALRWSGWLVRDFAYLAPLVLTAAIVPQARRAALGDRRVLACIVWMIGWVAIYLPWVFTVEYYLLPFALGAAVVAAALTDLSLNHFSQSGGLVRVATAALGATAASLFTISALGMVSSARQQLMVDRVNEWALRMIRDTLPPSSTLLVNHQFPGEYVEEIRLHLLYLWRRSDIRVDYVRLDEIASQAPEAGPRYVLLSVVQNQPLLTVRMGIVEPSVREWNRSLEGFLAEAGTAVWEAKDEIVLYNVNLVRLLCPLVSTRAFCEVDEPLIDRRGFSYGWVLYSIPATTIEEMGPALEVAAERAQRWE
jgi:hypothetical protein